jgi:hypothetical protein
MPFTKFMKYKFSFTLLLTLYMLTVNAQSTVDSVKLTVNNLFIRYAQCKTRNYIGKFYR